MKKYCSHCGAKMKISQMVSPAAGPIAPMPGEIGTAPMGSPLGGIGGPPLGGPALGGPMGPITPEQELNQSAKEDVKKTILDIIDDEEIDDVEGIYEELQDEGWTSKRLRELFPEKEGGIGVFIEQVIDEEEGNLKEEEDKEISEEEKDTEEIEEEKEDLEDEKKKKEEPEEEIEETKEIEKA